MEHEVCKQVNNIRYLYKESGCRTWKEFSDRCGISAVTLSKYNWEGVQPSEETLRNIAKAFKVDVLYFQQDRPLLSLKTLNYGNHLEHHVSEKYPIDEIEVAFSKTMAAETPDFGIFESILKENHLN